MKFKPVSLDQATRYKTAVTAFGGVDYATQRFSVDSGHAIDVLNFVRKNGIVQKRNGYEQVYQLEPFNYYEYSYDDGSEILHTSSSWTEDDFIVNGMWRFLAEDGEYHVIAHIGTILYEIENFGEEGMEAVPLSISTTNSAPLLYPAENYKSSAFVGANILYFLSGYKFMCVRFKKSGTSTSITYEPVEDMSELYVPTTTIGITYANSAVSSRANLDKVNLLSKFRINELVSGSGKGDSVDDDSLAVQNEFFDYTLDAPIVYESESDMDEFLISIDYLGEVDY